MSNRYILYVASAVPGSPESKTSERILAVPILLPAGVMTPVVTVRVVLVLLVINCFVVSYKLTVDPVLKSNTPTSSFTIV